LAGAVLMPGYAKDTNRVSLEEAFTAGTGTGFTDRVYSVAIQSDNKIVCGGLFTSFSGTALNYIVRLNTSGTVDTAFLANIGTGFNDPVNSVVVQPDGKILVGGDFTSFNGVTVNRIVRLNADGTQDTTFTTNTGTAFSSDVYAISFQPDGKIVCGGFFISFNGATVNRIVRLNADGTQDTTFTTNNGTGFNFQPYSLATQSDGKIIVAGSFTSFNGTTTNRIARLNSNGTLDTTFTTNIGTGFCCNQVQSVAVQPDGKIVCAGPFITFNGTTVNYIARLDSNGTLDTAFTTNTGTAFSHEAASLAIQADGKIIVGGNFTSFNGTTSRRIARLNSDGTLDTVFAGSTGGAVIGGGFNGRVTSIAIQSDGKIVCAGEFTSFSGTAVRRIAVLTNWIKTAPWTRSSGVWAKAKETYANVAGTWRQWWLDGGVNDRTFTEFDVYSGFNSTVLSIAIQSDGKIICGGSFTSFNGTTVNYIVRLNSNATIDTSFATNTGTGFNNEVYSIAIQSDGKIICGGFFTTFNGVTVNGIVRLNSDGTRDTSFTTNTGTGFNGTVESIAIQSDGKIVLGGSFTSFNGTTVNYIVRLNSDGTRETAFTANTGTGFNNVVRSLAIQSDGKIICGGLFATFNGTTVNRIVRLNSDGTRDTSFTTNTGTGFDSNVFSIAIQADGKIILGGGFTTFNGTTVNYILRLNSDGTRDTAFTANTGTGFNSSVNSIAIQSDGKIVIGGGFTTFNSVTVNGIVRLNSDGTRDTIFTTNTGTGFDYFDVDYREVYPIAIQSDGKIICGGFFTTFNETTINRIVRLNSDGTRDTTISISTGFDSDVNSIAIQSDGKIVCGGGFTTFNGVTVNCIVRLNSDGTRDTAFTASTGTAFNGIVYSIAIQSDGKIVVGGDFTTFNGTTINRIVRLNSDGTRDTAFTTNTGTAFNSSVRSVAIQSDGKIVLGGTFTTFNGVTVNRIVRLNSDGIRDTAFNANTGSGFNDLVNLIVVQSDGKLVIVGNFTLFNGVTVNRIVRLNSDGTRDTAFTTNTGTGFNNAASSIVIQSDGKLVIGGGFTTFNGVTVNRIVRLNSDGTRDATFTTNTGTAFNSTVNSIAIQSDGKIICGGFFTTFNGTTVNYIVRLNSDGTRETAFTANNGTGFDNSVRSVAIQSDGKIILGGFFTTFNNTNRTRLARIGGE
jgi:uncharacterized delta-60 repeat protein